LSVIRQEWQLTNVEDLVPRQGIRVYEALERHRRGGPFRESGKNFSEVGKSTGSEHWKVTLQDMPKTRFRAAVSKHDFSTPYSYHDSGLPLRKKPPVGRRAVRNRWDSARLAQM